jgi:hypothetical protein
MSDLKVSAAITPGKDFPDEHVVTVLQPVETTTPTLTGVTEKKVEAHSTIVKFLGHKAKEAAHAFAHAINTGAHAILPVDVEVKATGSVAKPAAATGAGAGADKSAK